LDYKEIKKEQEAILQRVKQPYSKPIGEVTGTNILTKLLVYSEKEIYTALGSLGPALGRFAQDIDLHHPSLLTLYGGQLVSERESSFNQFASDMLKLAAYAHNQELSRFTTSSLQDVTKDHVKWREFKKNIDSPSKNGKHIHLLKERKDRDAIRARDFVRNVDLRLLKKRGMDYWCEQPHDFKHFYRHVGRFEDEKKAASERYEHFKSFGLSCMAFEIAKTMTFIEEKSQKLSFLGFNRITHTQAAIILSKMAGFEMSDITCQISAKSDIFGTDFILNDFSTSHWVNCQVRAYALNEMWADTCGELRSIIAHLEKLPEFGDRAIFDRYRILIPGFNCPGNGPFKIKIESQVHYHSEIEEAHKELDLTFVKNQFVPAALLGERDGVSYFICYWM
jgi:hypothetical protein